MYRKVEIIGAIKKTVPAWFLSLALLAAGAGSAAGIVLGGKVKGEIPVAVSQSLLVCTPEWKDVVPADVNQPQQVNRHVSWIHKPNRSVGVAADDHTGFQAAAEMAIGDWAAFNLPIKNASDIDLVAELTMCVPECIEVEVYAATTATGIKGVVRTGANTWKIIVDAAAECRTVEDCLMVVISVDDNCMPGFFNLGGELKQIPY